MEPKLTELIVAALVVNNKEKAKEIFATHGDLIENETDLQRFDLRDEVSVFILYKKDSAYQAVVQTTESQVVIKSTDKIVKKLIALYNHKLEKNEIETIPVHSGMKRVLFISANPHIENTYMVGVRYDKEAIEVGAITKVDLGLSTCGYGVIAQVA
ncbi:hypothetical protein LMH73_023000 [Vibrio splendidus]|nr:hypothetical protein [Vibrio splendidus]MCC4883024.1 hypothetical protein [Vibrio splendidus]